MKINYSNINFNSRKPSIRKADKIVRNVNNNFPMFSALSDKPLLLEIAITIGLLFLK